jgi:hypothetical protein
MQRELASGAPSVDRRAALRYLAVLSSSLVPTVGLRSAAVAIRDYPSLFKRIPKALWIWRTGLADLPKVSAFMSQWGFTTALYSIPPNDRARLAAEPELAREALSNLRQEERRVLLVAGDPAWLVKGGFAAGEQQLPLPIAGLLDLASRTGARGLALDVEPYALPNWKTSERPILAQRMISMFRMTKSQCERRKLALWAALHPSQVTTPDPDGHQSNLAGALIEHLDVAVVMAYRNTVESALAFGNGLVMELARQGVDWYFGLTTQTSAQAARVSYYGFDPARFVATVADLDEALRSGPGAKTYRGIAVHQFTTTSELLT